MPSSFSDKLRLELIADGEQEGTWGPTTNTNLGTLLEAAIAGFTSIALADSNYTLTANNGTADEARSAAIAFTGTLTATRTITLPSSKSKLYIFRNGTNQSLIFSAGGTTYTLATGDRAIVFVDTSGNVTDQFDSVQTLKVKGNTTLGDASGDTVTHNASTVSIPNGLNFGSGVLNLSGGNVSTTGDLSVNSDGNSATINLGNTAGSFYAVIQQDAATTGKVRYNSYAASGTSHGHRFEINGNEKARVSGVGAFKASTDGTYSAADSLHELKTDNNTFGTLIANTNTTAAAIAVRFDLGGGGAPTGKIFTGFAGGGEKIYAEADGDVYNVNGTYGTISDGVTKEDISTNTTKRTPELMKLRIVNFKSKLDPKRKRQLGMVAQEVEQVFPSFVKTNPDGIKTISKSLFIDVLIQGFQEQQQTIEALVERIEKLEKRG